MRKKVLAILLIGRQVFRPHQEFSLVSLLTNRRNLPGCQLYTWMRRQIKNLEASQDSEFSFSEEVSS
jgi:hypothetical protein